VKVFVGGLLRDDIYLTRVPYAVVLGVLLYSYTKENGWDRRAVVALGDFQVSAEGTHQDVEQWTETPKTIVAVRSCMGGLVYWVPGVQGGRGFFFFSQNRAG
jgi:hypothetical protein